MDKKIIIKNILKVVYCLKGETRGLGAIGRNSQYSREFSTRNYDFP